MQKLTQLTYLLLLLGLLLPACQKDDDNMVPADNCFLSANIDGNEFRWELNNCSFNNQILRVGDILLGDEAEMTVEPVDNTGTFQSTNPDHRIGFFLTLGPGLQIFEANVQIEVTSFTGTEAEGTFRGFFTDISGTNYQVDNGMFRAVFQ